MLTKMKKTKRGNKMSNIAVIFAGGIGRRMSSQALPKQFLQLYDKEIIVYTLEHFENHPNIDGIVIACVEEWIPYMLDLIDKYRLKKVLSIVPGGKTGQGSIYNGLVAAQKYGDGEEDIVLIHDGVRPLINATTISDCLDSVRLKGSAITVAPVVETIIKVEGEKIEDVIERSKCWVARAPQCFKLDEILNAHHQAQRESKEDFIDSASIMRHYGYSLATVMGPVENIKITTPMDYHTFQALYDTHGDNQLFGN